jgi:hypothetical protein
MAASVQGWRDIKPLLTCIQILKDQKNQKNSSFDHYGIAPLMLIKI